MENMTTICFHADNELGVLLNCLYLQHLNQKKKKAAIDQWQGPHHRLSGWSSLSPESQLQQVSRSVGVSSPQYMLITYGNESTGLVTAVYNKWSAVGMETWSLGLPLSWQSHCEPSRAPRTFDRSLISHLRQAFYLKNNESIKQIDQINVALIGRSKSLLPAVMGEIASRGEVEHEDSFIQKSSKAGETLTIIVEDEGNWSEKEKEMAKIIVRGQVTFGQVPPPASFWQRGTYSRESRKDENRPNLVVMSTPDGVVTPMQEWCKRLCEKEGVLVVCVEEEYPEKNAEKIASELEEKLMVHLTQTCTARDKKREFERGVAKGKEHASRQYNAGFAAGAASAVAAEANANRRASARGDRDRDGEDAPHCFVCPITLDIMRDPVITPSGHSYERSAILEHIHRSGTDPMTRSRLTPSDLIPNRNLRDAISMFGRRRRH